ncbi:protein serine/threonine kinase, putative [Entamoeba invadens IP1]|uniref:Protein serine/threonine kinase, putative n=1 Tax=Entamoeba invadens IP1 TaxID=370355 RepID=L7FPC6_ENTIV|nr:protein serine/threonine kinase, putative [Entamoeba invadens IP1]ELP94689.1 protein serine/threonine kinase, putative [Entamoeba invadens IP1]|eukprot:XP_004261460.1 protein serine/threonine kinase, putative [Entamoeba invadens IP1]
MNIKENVTFDYCVLSFLDFSNITFYPSTVVKVESCIEFFNATKSLFAKKSSIEVRQGIYFFGNATQNTQLEVTVESGASLYLYSEHFILSDYCNIDVFLIERYRECFAVILDYDSIAHVKNPSILEPPLFTVMKGNTKVKIYAFIAADCFDIFGFREIHAGADSDIIKLIGDGKVQRVCPKNKDVFNTTVYCHMNGTNYMNEYLLGETKYSFTHPNCPYTSSEANHLMVFSENKEVTVSGINNKILYIEFVGEEVDVTMDSNNQIFLYGTFRNSGAKDMFQSYIPKCSAGFTQRMAYFSSFARYFLNCKDHVAVEPNVDTLDIGLTDSIYRVVAMSNMPLIVYTKIDEDYTKFSPIKSVVGYMVLSERYFNFTNGNQINLYDNAYYKNNTLYGYTRRGGKYVKHKYYLGNSQYAECPENTLECNNETFAIKCEKDYFMAKSGKCASKTENLCRGVLGDICLKTSNYFDFVNGKSVSCNTNCLTCNDNTCEICKEGKIMRDGMCEDVTLDVTSFNNQNKNLKSTAQIVTSTTSVISCPQSYFVSNLMCTKCSSKFMNCDICNKKKCEKCASEYSLDSNDDCYNTHCILLVSNRCEKCTDGYALSSDGTCVPAIENCMVYSNTICDQCTPNTKLFNNTCTENLVIPDEDQCLEYDFLGCSRCKDGYYTGELNMCQPCNIKCRKCTGNAEKCQDCITGTVLINGKCVTLFELEGICKEFNLAGNCVLCADGYFVYNSSCSECNDNCAICKNEFSCEMCKKDYFRNESLKCEIASNLHNCASYNENGCLQCESGYFRNSKRCEKCSENCESCTDRHTCLECLNNWELTDGMCKERNYIVNCVNVFNSYCEECERWYSLSDDKTSCKSEMYKRNIIIIVVCVVVAIFIVAIVMIVLGQKLIKMHIRKKERKDKGVISLKENAVELCVLGEELLSSVKSVQFPDQIEVNKETQTSLVLGNKSDYTIKLQITTKKMESYSLKIVPSVVILRSNECCTFTVSITPNCSGDFSGNLGVVYCHLKTGKEITENIPFTAETVLSTWIDDNSITYLEQIGKGGFGLVYKGIYKTNKVAVKKLNITNGDTLCDEFENEVEMLDKMKSPYIIRFFGAVHIGNSRMIIMELAAHGSLMRLIEKIKKKKITKKLKTKILLDAAKGVSYLHTNGILHRDIKPGNILICDYSYAAEVNAKLSDFGSSRNVNRATAFDMTFTTGIGTPVYMAPELLNCRKYTLPADVYAFGITCYECFIWDKAYKEIKFAFQIANYVCEGKRPETSELDEDVVEILNGTWKQDPKERTDIQEIVKEFEELFKRTIEDNNNLKLEAL